MSSPPSKQHLELWVSLILMALIIAILLGATMIMMAIGGVFIPFGFDSDFFTRLLDPVTIGVVLGFAAVVAIVAVVVPLRHLRRNEE